MSLDGEIQGEHWPTPEEEDEKKSLQIDNDPTEYLPVLRHHLHESLWALTLASNFIAATDLAESYRQGLTLPRESPLSRQLVRANKTLAGYLGIEETDDVPEG